MRNLTISTSVRPGRVAVLVDVNDDHWQNTCLRVIEYFTRMWGGCGNIIVPTDGKSIAPLFWSILERFDPDYLRGYQRTGKDFEIEEPTRFEQIYNQRIAAWEKQIGQATDQYAADSIRDNLRRGSATEFEVSPELQQQLKERLAPFYFQQWIVEAGAVWADSTPHHPHTDIIEILPQIEHSTRVLRVNDKAGAVSPLWWGSVFGCVNLEMQSQLASQKIEVLELGTTQDEIRNLIRLAVEGYENIHSVAFLAHVSTDTVREWLQTYPSRLSMAGLGSYRSLQSHDWEEPAVAVAGNNIQDFALYYALSCMRTRVAWILPSITADALGQTPKRPTVNEEFHFAHALGTVGKGNSQHTPGLKLISASLSNTQLENVGARLEQVAMMSAVAYEIGNASDSIPVYPVRHYEANNASRMHSITVPDDGVIPLFETPLPKNFKTVDPSKHRWITELGLNKYHLPRHYALGRWMMGAPYFTTKDVRVTSEGPAYFCPSNLIMGGIDAEGSVPRPSIRIPETLEVFEEVARQSGLSCAISDKGFYAQSTCEKFGGLHLLADFLRSASGQLFIAAFLDKSKPVKGDHLKGALPADRRYLDLDSLSAILADQNEACKTLDLLSLLRVLYRGFVLQCQYCRDADWFALSDLTDTFTCKRCHRSQIFTQKHWRYPEQPRLYYQLDELVYQGAEHNMQVPLLALDRLRRESKDSFLHAPELSYRVSGAEKPLCEVDLNCIVDGILTIGEAKKDDRLGKNDSEESAVISRYLDLGKKLGARQIVFATSSDQWRSSTLDKLCKAFGDHYLRLKILTREHLYT